MGVQPLGPKLCRQIAREIGQPIKRAVGSGGNVFGFVTYAHEHGYWSRVLGESGLHDTNDGHWASCRWLFPEYGAERARAEEVVAAAFAVPLRMLAPRLPADLCGATARLHGDDLICQRDTYAAADSTDPHPGKPHWCGSEQWWIQDGVAVDHRHVNPRERYHP